jgi:hypothetical protein
MKSKGELSLNMSWNEASKVLFKNNNKYVN